MRGVRLFLCEDSATPAYATGALPIRYHRDQDRIHDHDHQRRVRVDGEGTMTDDPEVRSLKNEVSRLEERTNQLEDALMVLCSVLDDPDESLPTDVTSRLPENLENIDPSAADARPVEMRTLAAIVDRHDGPAGRPPRDQSTSGEHDDTY